MLNRDKNTPLHEQKQAERYDPPGVLRWDSAAERNKLLIPWRLAVSIGFAEHPRCLRVAWVLDHLFNIKTGFCNASNPYLAKFTGLSERNVQKALEKLEKDGAIRRLITPPSAGGQRWRAIYPATEILSVAGVGSRLPGGVTGNVHLPDVHILRKKKPRVPRTQLEHARLAAEARQTNEQGCAASGNGRDRPSTRSRSARTESAAAKPTPEEKDSSEGGKIVSGEGTVLICETIRHIPGCEHEAASMQMAIRGAISRALGNAVPVPLAPPSGGG